MVRYIPLSVPIRTASTVNIGEYATNSPSSIEVSGSLCYI